MSEHTRLKLKNNEPDEPNSRAIYLVALSTIIFLTVSIVGLKWLHSYFEDKTIKSYELQEKPFAKEHQEKENKFLDEVNNGFNKAIN